jgi:AcrR family transcriptional regulator/predicted DNA-binding transcriptional regulator AlpA
METEVRLLRISELEKLSGVPRYTIHQYLRSGLLPEPLKTSRTMAYYSEVHLDRLRVIKGIKGSSRVPLSFLKKILDEEEEVAEGKSGRGETGAKAPAEPNRTAMEKRKRQIRDAALKVFLEKGYQHARIQDITIAAGISTGTFYIYYRDKRDLFMDAIDELIKNTVKELEDAAAKEGDFLKAAVAVSQFYIENYGYFSGIINQLRGLMASAEPSAREKFIALHNSMADPIAREIRSAIKKGLIRDVDPELLARAIMGMVEFLSIFLSFDERHSAPQAISFMIDLIMNGVGK